MFRSIRDWFTGNNREQAENDVGYSTRLNGETQRAPPWPQPRQENENMFLLPRKLNPGDRIDVSGILTNGPRILTVNLITGDSAPDYDNIACQLEARFPTNSYDENKITVNTIYNGDQEEIIEDDEQNKATTWIADSTNFTFGFTIRINDNGQQILIYIGASFFQEITLKHNIEDIRFLTVNGDVAKIEKLDFIFG